MNKNDKEELQDVIDQAIDDFNDHDLDGWMQFYAEDAVHIQPNRDEPLSGKAAIREDYLNSTWIPFPDFHFESERSFGEGEWMCVTGILTGTHTGPLPGEGDEVIPPTHHTIRVPICMVIRFEDGKAVEVYEYNDQLALLMQLGLMDEV